MGDGLSTVYFDSGGRQDGYPTVISIWNLGEGAEENIAKSAGIYWDLGEEPVDVTVGNHPYSKLVQDAGDVTYEAFVGDWYILAGYGRATNAQDAEQIISTVLGRIP
jgi:hypothetical protein